MILWMVWATVLAGLLGTAAALGEWTLRALGRPGRFAWLAAAGASVGLPAWALVRPPPVRGAGALIGAATAVADATRAARPGLLSRVEALLAAPPALLPHADPFVIGAWAAASVTLTVALVLGLSHLRRRARHWPTAHVGGGDALLSEDFGPALVGLRAPRVVIPRWAFSLGADRLAMAWAHEDEHRAVGDGWLFVAGAMVVILAPWNAALWWQVRRLRAAAELDCDARVLRRGFRPAAYGALLLDVGSRSSELPFPVAALSRSPTLLERRLTMIVNGVRRNGPWATAAAAVGALALVAVACQAPAPTTVQSTAEKAVPSEQHSQPTKIVWRGSLADMPDSLRPLFVVDGTVTGTTMPDLDPNSIGRVDVYKGETAMKRYGARGAHGVIVITTKGAGGGDGGK